MPAWCQVLRRASSTGQCNTISAFNLGIETMQIIVVAVALPPLMILSRTSAYSSLRMGGAMFAGVASLGWVLERLLNIQNSVDSIVNAITHHVLWLALNMLVLSVACRYSSFLVRMRTGGVNQPAIEH
jgi:hypothetical protein